MIIAFDITQAIYGTGVSAYITNLLIAISRLKPKSVRFKLFALTPTGRKRLKSWQQKLNSAIFSFYFYPLPQRLRLLSLRFKVDPSLLIGKYDILHTPDWTGYYSRKPTIATIHDLAIYRYPKLFPKSILDQQKKYLSWASSEADRIICVSKASQKDFQTHYPQARAKTKLIYEANPFEFTLAADWNQVRSRYQLKAGEKYLIAIGTLEPRKNLSRLISGFIEAKLKGYKLLIAGKVGWGDIKIKKSKDVSFLGYVADNHLVSLLQHSQGLVYPSLWEGFGLPLAAGLNYQIPILTSNRGSMKEIAPKSILVNPLDYRSISKGLKQLVDVHKSQAGQNSFSWLKTGQETLNLYQNILKL